MIWYRRYEDEQADIREFPNHRDRFPCRVQLNDQQVCFYNRESQSWRQGVSHSYELRFNKMIEQLVHENSMISAYSVFRVATRRMNCMPKYHAEVGFRTPDDALAFKLACT